ncbi:MAG: DUF4402 domain-containing protein [Sphingomonadales bacterium]|nr:DUF4402 domain-containing protein [Sphingomonadales bacterium]
MSLQMIIAISLFLLTMMLHLPFIMADAGRTSEKGKRVWTRHWGNGACIIAGFILLCPAAAMAANGQGTTKTTLVRPMTLVKVADLDMGRILPGPAASTVTVDVNGTRTKTGPATLIGTDFQPARFAGEGDPNGPSTGGFGRARITLPNQIFLTGPGPQMRLNNFRFGPDSLVAPSIIQNGNSPNIRLTRPDRVFGFVVGGTLAVGANQPGGIYTGTFTVTVDYN